MNKIEDHFLLENICYFYKAKITRVYDGDTVYVEWDLGCSVHLFNEPLRLNRIDTPEVRGKEKVEGIKVRDYVSDMLLGNDVYLMTIKDKKGSFSRYLAEIWVYDDKGQLINFNDHLLDIGYALPFKK